MKTQAQKDFDTYINLQIDITLKKGAHKVLPSRNYTEVLAALIDEGIKKGISVKSRDNIIYLAVTRPLPESPKPKSHPQLRDQLSTE